MNRRLTDGQELLVMVFITAAAMLAYWVFKA